MLGNDATKVQQPKSSMQEVGFISLVVEGGER